MTIFQNKTHFIADENGYLSPEYSVRKTFIDPTIIFASINIGTLFLSLLTQTVRFSFALKIVPSSNSVENFKHS